MPLFKAPEDFKTPFRNYSNDELIAIVTVNKDNHPARAVEAARQILQERGVRFGAPQPEPVSQPYRPPVQQKKTNTWVWVVIFIIIIRLILAIGRHANQ